MNTSNEERFIAAMDSLRDMTIKLNNHEQMNLTEEEIKFTISRANKDVKDILYSSRKLEGYQKVMKNKKNWKAFTMGWITTLWKTMTAST